MVEVLPTICLTNDDGPNSIGLLRLAETIAQNAQVVVVVPNEQRSGVGKALTLGRPIRILSDSQKDGYRIIIHDGFPADSVIIALSMIKKIDVFVSGINSGANVGYHRMLTSGTVGAILEAILNGYPGIAISYAVSPVHWFSQEGVSDGIESVCRTSAILVDHILDKGLPEGIDGLNVNFPAEYSEQGEVVFIQPSNIGVKNQIERRLDPYDIPYYWIRGGEEVTDENHDAKEVVKNGKITISPIIIRSVTDKHTQRIREHLRELF